MKRSHTISEKGQSLVIVALLMFAFLGMLALVLDGGNAYFQRRNAQNAADAGALAATSTWCETGDWGLAYADGIQYSVTENGVDSATVSQVDPDNRIVQVKTSITFNTFFGRILGQPQMTAVASAKAGCYPISSGLGVLPIAWSCRDPIPVDDDDPYESDECAIRYMDEGEVCTPASDLMYVIVDSATIEEETLCQSPPNSGIPAGAVDCDIDDDGENDLEPLSGGNRSWLDLDGGGGGASSLSEWVQYGFPEDINTHYWFAGQTGVANSVYKDVENYQEGNDVIIPVFDQLCPNGVPDTGCPAMVHENPPDPYDDTIIASGGSSTDYFHIISFSVFHITCVDSASSGPCPGNKALDMDPNVKTIEGCFVRDYTPGGGGGPNDNPWMGAWTVYLLD